MGKTLLKQVQEVVSEAVEDIRSLGLPPLGAEFAQLHGTDLHQALIAHRATKGFERPNVRGSARRRESSVRGFLDTNASLTTQFNYWDLAAPDRRSFLGARAWLSGVLTDFVPTYRFAFPSGEGVISEQGMTDFFHKLSLDSQWTVSIDAVPYAARIAYRNASLKRVVRERFRAQFPYHWRRMARGWYEEAQKKKLRDPGLHSFTYMFAGCCDIVGVSRITTVPKNNEKDRVITCEPTWNMVAQLSLALDLRECLRRRTGISIQFWQEVHKSLIRSGRATVDFSDASNRNIWSVVKALFPRRVVRHLEKLRNALFEYDGEYYPVNMLAPMGCGFTFDMLTLTLLAYARQFDPAASAFGDDIILSQESAAPFMEFVEKLGWKVNHSKTYVAGNFRESCGAFCDLGEDKLLLSYDLLWPDDEQACYVLGNKISRLVKTLNRGPVRDILVRCYERLHSCFPRDAYAEDDGGDLCDWLFFTEEEGCTNAARSTAVQLWSAMWQRPIELRSASESRAVEGNAVKHDIDNVRLACFLRRGASYGIPTGKFKESRITRDKKSGETLSGVTLVSIL